jgi:hypothetical protein
MSRTIQEFKKYQGNIELVIQALAGRRCQPRRDQLQANAAVREATSVTLPWNELPALASLASAPITSELTHHERAPHGPLRTPGALARNTLEWRKHPAQTVPGPVLPTFLQSTLRQIAARPSSHIALSPTAKNLLNACSSVDR